MSLLVVTACITQSKWTLFKTSARRLQDFDLFDNATRGPSSGLILLSRVRWGLAENIGRRPSNEVAAKRSDPISCHMHLEYPKKKPKRVDSPAYDICARRKPILCNTMRTTLLELRLPETCGLSHTLMAGEEIELQPGILETSMTNLIYFSQYGLLKFRAVTPDVRVLRPFGVLALHGQHDFWPDTS
jgi:hypothetical protein